MESVRHRAPPPVRRQQQHPDRDALLRNDLSGSDDAALTRNQYRNAGTRKWQLTGQHWLMLMAVYLASYTIGRYQLDHLPHPDAEGALSHPDNHSIFNEERAFHHADTLHRFYPRTTGTTENEVYAVTYIRRAVGDMQARSNERARGLHKIELDMQLANGGFNISFFSGLNSLYSGIQNVVVRISSPKSIGRDYSSNNNTILINCHYDAAFSSPGFHDDLIQCGVMLELLNNLAHSTSPLPYPVIFLFNGAEETLLQASHAFVTQHRWSKDVRTLINLEAAGAGGKDVLFQSGPRNAWIPRVYSTVPYPLGSVLAQEIFQSNAIPGDTDFRQFRDYGHIPGVDIAYAANGYVYHTPYDNASQFTRGSAYRSGANIHAMLRGIMSSPEFAVPEATCPSCNQTAVFFDYAGIWFIFYDHDLGQFLNYAGVFLSLTCAAFRFAHMKQQASLHGIEINISNVLAATTITPLLSLLAAVGCSAAYGMFMSRFAPLAFYQRIWLAFPLYFLPATGGVFLIHKFLAYKLRRWPSDWLENAVLIEFNVFFALILFMLTLIQVDSAVFVLLAVIFGFPLRYLVERLAPRVKLDATQTLAVHVSVAVPALVELMYVVAPTLDVFVPIMGRSGSLVDADLLISFVIGLMAFGLSTFYVSLLYRTDPKVVNRMWQICFAIGSAFALICATTPLGFPYAMKPDMIRPQRFIMTHNLHRSFDRTGHEYSHNAYLFSVPLDCTGLKYVREHVPLYEKAVKMNSCKSDLMCGYPFVFPVYEKITTLYRINTDKAEPNFPTQTIMRLTRTDQRTTLTKRFHFELIAPAHANLYVYMYDAECIVSRWSVPGDNYLRELAANSGGAHLGSIPRHSRVLDGRNKFYFLYMTKGTMPPQQVQNFWLDVQCTSRADDEQSGAKVRPCLMIEGHHEERNGTAEANLLPCFQVGIAGHYVESSSAELNALIAQHPHFSTMASWIVDYQTYQI